MPIGDFLHVFHLETEWDEEHVLGKEVLVQASQGEEDILHLHWYKRVSKLCTICPGLYYQYWYHTECEFT